MLIQKGRIGGDYTFTGCVPSKALLAAAARGESFGEAMLAVHRAVETIATTEDDVAPKRDGVEVIHGWATMRSSKVIGSSPLNGATLGDRPGRGAGRACSVAPYRPPGTGGGSRLSGVAMCFLSSVQVLR